MDKKKISFHLIFTKNFEIQKYQNEPRFNGIFSRDNVPNKINDGTYVINLDEYADTGAH